jgi:hypothetical protein
MGKVGRWSFAVSLCAFASGATSCAAANPLPGTSLGTYNVTGTLESNSCGSGLGAPNPWSFTAQMSEDGTVLYWEPSGGELMSNTMSSATQVSMTSAVTTNVDSSDAGLAGPCDLQTTTAVSLTLATGTPPASFTGTLSYSFEAAVAVSPTTNCTDQLSASGGTFDTLPCTTTYTLSAAHAN